MVAHAEFDTVPTCCGCAKQKRSVGACRKTLETSIFSVPELFVSPLYYPVVSVPFPAAHSAVSAFRSRTSSLLSTCLEIREIFHLLLKGFLSTVHLLCLSTGSFLVCNFDSPLLLRCFDSSVLPVVETCIL